MKLINLNTWGGLAGKELLLNFFNNHQDVIDIFCLQEIWSAPYEHLEGQPIGPIKLDQNKVMVYGLQDISTVLKNYNMYFKPHHLENYGLAIFIKKDIEVIAEGEVFVHKTKGYIPLDNPGFHARNIQYATIVTKHGNRTIINFHGLWNGQGKGDSEDRLLQSNNIIQFIKTLSDPCILTGDFNLKPDTESIKILENSELRNLIKENNITSTRTSFYTKEEKFADYTFTSKDIIVKDFKILPDEVSDHSPLF